MEIINRTEVNKVVRDEIIRSVNYIKNNQILEDNKQNFISKLFNKNNSISENLKHRNYIKTNFFKDYFDLLGAYYSYPSAFNYLYSGYFQKETSQLPAPKGAGLLKPI